MTADPREQRTPSGAGHHGDARDTREARLARALADPTRRAIYQLVAERGSAAQPVDVAALTEAMGLHHTAVRQHLAQLREVGLVVEERLPPRGRGRPRLGFRANPAMAPGGDNPYRHLAELLARALRTGVGARETGRRAGKRAAREHPEHRGDPVTGIVAEAARLGFRPATEPTGRGVDVVLQACPFGEVAAADPKTICQLHLGLAEGLAEGFGGASVHRLHVEDPMVGGCRIEVDLEPPSTSGPTTTATSQATAGRAGQAPRPARRPRG